jgi:elongation factor G
MTLEGISVPPPAISFSIEAGSAREVQHLEDALCRLHKEDPSLQHSSNEHGQTIISGMGELHLDIIMSRLKREYHLNCKLLRAVIEYREAVSFSLEVKNITCFYNELPVLDCDMVMAPSLCEGKLPPEASVSAEIDDTFVAERKTSVSKSVAGEAAASRKALIEAELATIGKAFSQAVTEFGKMGPVAGLPVIGVRFTLQRYRVRVPPISAGQALGAFRSALQQLIAQLDKSSIVIVEPMMHVEVHLTEPTFIGDVIASLNERHPTAVNLLEDGKSVEAIVPMRNIVRYTMDLRKAAKGHANFYTRLDHYREVDDKLVVGKILRNRGVTA